MNKTALFSYVLQAVQKTEDEAKPEEVEKPKPKKFNVDEHFNHELHAIMKYLFPSLMPQAEEVVKKTEKIAKSPTKKRKRVENGASTSGSSSKAATNKGDNKTNTTVPKKTYAIFDMAKRPKELQRTWTILNLFRFLGFNKFQNNTPISIFINV